MKRIEIEFVVGRQGTISSTVKHVKGSDCGRISRLLESGLGRVIDKTKTAEYFDTREVTHRFLHQEIEKF